MILDGLVKVIGRNLKNTSIIGYIERGLSVLEHQLQELLRNDSHMASAAKLSQHKVDAALQESLVFVCAGGDHAIEKCPHEDGVVEPEALEQRLVHAKRRVRGVFQCIQGESAVKSRAILEMPDEDAAVLGNEQQLAGADKDVVAVHLYQDFSFHEIGECVEGKAIRCARGKRVGPSFIADGMNVNSCISHRL